MDHDLTQLKRQVQAKQRQSFQLDPFVLETLDNFGHRYLPRKPSANAQKLDDHTYAIRSEETNLAQAMANTSDAHISQKLQAAAPRKLLYGLSLELSLTNSHGQVSALAFINYGDPPFPLVEEKMVYKTQKTSFSHPLELRRKLPLCLEQVCELFS